MIIRWRFTAAAPVSVAPGPPHCLDAPRGEAIRAVTLSCMLTKLLVVCLAAAPHPQILWRGWCAVAPLSCGNGCAIENWSSGSSSGSVLCHLVGGSACYSGGFRL
jgi:hypothetical protein